MLIGWRAANISSMSSGEERFATFPCEVEATNSTTNFKEYPATFMIIPVELMCFVIFSNTFRERTVHVNTRGKGRKSYESTEKKVQQFASKDLQAERVAKVIERPGDFRDCNRRINDQVGLVYVVMCEVPQVPVAPNSASMHRGGQSEFQQMFSKRYNGECQFSLVQSVEATSEFIHHA